MQLFCEDATYNIKKIKKKKIAHEKLKKPPKEVVHNHPKPSPKLIFHIMKSRDQTSVLLFVSCIFACISKVVSHEHLLSYYILLTKLNFGLAFATQGSGIFEASR